MITISVLTGLGYLVAAVALRAGRFWPRWFVAALAVPATAVGAYLAISLGFTQDFRLGYPAGRYGGFGALAIALALTLPGVDPGVTWLTGRRPAGRTR